MSDLAALLVPGRALTVDDVLALSARLERPWQTQRRWMKARQDAILAALEGTGEPSPTVACATLARALARLSSSGPVHPPSLVPLAAEVLRLNDGQPVGWRTLHRAIPPDHPIVKKTSKRACS